jgi:hypothetical protein
MVRHTRQHCDYQNGFAEIQTTLKIPVRKPNFALVFQSAGTFPDRAFAVTMLTP